MRCRECITFPICQNKMIKLCEDVIYTRKYQIIVNPHKTEYQKLQEAIYTIIKIVLSRFCIYVEGKSLDELSYELSQTEFPDIMNRKYIEFKHKMRMKIYDDKL